MPYHHYIQGHVDMRCFIYQQTILPHYAYVQRTKKSLELNLPKHTIKSELPDRMQWTRFNKDAL